MTETAVRTPARTAGSRRELQAAVVGGVVESFDWAVYGVFAPYFADQIFPGHGSAAKLIAAYAGFAVGFLFRPLGGVLVGRLADRRGRRAVLSLSVGAIAAANLLLAITPTYSVIGLGAAVVFMLARLAQGLSAGGEAPTVAAYVAETAPAHRRYLYSALSYSGLIAGSILAFAVLGVGYGAMGKSGLEHGGWRLGFAVAALLGWTALWIRRRAPESAEFQRHADSGATRGPARPVLAAHRRQSTAIFLITVSGTVGFYFGTLYLPTYAHKVGAISSVKAGAAQLDAALVLLILAMALFGMLADRIDGLTVLRVSVVLQAVVTAPLMLGLAAGTLPFLPVAVCYLLVFAPGLAIGYVLGARLFPVEVRSVGFGAPGAIAGALFGGTFPLIAEGLAHAHHIHAVPWYATACAVAGTGGALMIHREDLYEITP